MLAVGTYWWTPDQGSKFAAPYGPDDVRKLRRMVAKHCTVPHEFVVLTDQPDLFLHDKDIRAFHLSLAHQKTHVAGTCFVRLFTFSPYAREAIGDRFLQIDLDTMIVGNIDHLVTREEDLVLWRNPTRLPWADLDAEGRREFVEKTFPALGASLAGVDWSQRSIAYVGERGRNTYVVNQLRTHYNTSILFHRCGTKPEIWERFNPQHPPARDDQWYLSDLYGMDCPYFDGKRDGVYRWPRADTPDANWIDGNLPANACVVTFPGSHGKITDAIRAANPWIGEHSR